ncbi:LysR family transcriptional regulator [Pararoseomonas indoligenes]|uniref:LysR family transcriptional regulator n=1 Tax=Roseomonas indoligenes TaxID=2820811 RepID=A0A940N2I5_9PROT|nr:LysR substrate-binding domain-containing protein [Pararoseomonas indoligenes]MBP0495384.1 LysR family transcriptional regulator [Pararoseomonas indoligenes]
MTLRRYLDQRLKLHHLRAVEAIVAQSSLLKASAVLGITQPALTRTVQELEEIAGQRLFDRLPRGVRPTEAGNLLAAAARRILADLRRLDEALDRLQDPEGGTVAIGTLPVAATGVLPGALTRLTVEHPGIRVRLEQGRTEELLPKLASGEIDLIVGRLYEPASPDGFPREALWEEPISILARPGHPVFALEAVTLEALRRYDLILPTVSQRVGREIEALLGMLELEPASSMRSSSYGFIREMLLATDLIAVMPRLMMAGDLLRGMLRVVPLPVPAPRRPAGIIRPRDRAVPPAGDAFINCLRAHVVEIGQRGLTDITPGHTSTPESNRTGA